MSDNIATKLHQMAEWLEASGIEGIAPPLLFYYCQSLNEFEEFVRKTGAVRKDSALCFEARADIPGGKLFIQCFKSTSCRRVQVDTIKHKIDAHEAFEYDEPVYAYVCEEVKP